MGRHLIHFPKSVRLMKGGSDCTSLPVPVCLSLSHCALSPGLHHCDCAQSSGDSAGRDCVDKAEDPPREGPTAISTARALLSSWSTGRQQHQAGCSLLEYSLMSPTASGFSLYWGVAQPNPHPSPFPLVLMGISASFPRHEVLRGAPPCWWCWGWVAGQQDSTAPGLYRH